MLAFLGCSFERTAQPVRLVEHQLIIDRQLDESMRGEVSRIQERTVGRLSWTDEHDLLSGRFQIDSVRFLRDGSPRAVAPTAVPVARFAFHRTKGGDFIVDSMP